jgi:hypothetical protein
VARSAPEIFDQLYPGFMDRIRGYVEHKGGVFLEPTLCHPPQVDEQDGQVQRARMAIRIRIGKRTVLQVACRGRRDRGIWKLTYRSFHFGPTAEDMTIVHFRIDDNTQDGFHAHIEGHGPRPEKGGHFPIGEVEPPEGFPPLVHVDPISFLDLVDYCIANRTIPLKLKVAQ